jgi:NADH-quinone oxidoreductase subunit G
MPLNIQKKKIDPIYLNNQKILMQNVSFYRIPILSFLQTLKIKTPHFCFNSNLSVAGNCRMCLIELGKGGKPIPSCAINLTPGSEIFTNTAAIKKLRESVIEFLLLNHPLDCPICDQGSNCDLQDYAQQHGSSISRNYEIKKRTKAKKYYNNWVKIILTRCIHCTRCIRFSEELANSPNIGMGYRGRQSEIIIFNEKSHKKFSSNVLGHLIDLCPVGAITSKESAYAHRS